MNTKEKAEAAATSKNTKAWIEQMQVALNSLSSLTAEVTDLRKAVGVLQKQHDTDARELLLRRAGLGGAVLAQALG